MSFEEYIARYASENEVDLNSEEVRDFLMEGLDDDVSEEDAATIIREFSGDDDDSEPGGYVTRFLLL